MFTGKLLAICISPEAGKPMIGVDEVESVAGKGLTGDRYARGNGAFQKGGDVKPSQEVSLIEQEAIDAASKDYKLEITHADTRRNLLTSGVPLNHLVDKTFRVGEVVFKGVRLCEPCSYLESLTYEGIEKALKHRGGLRAQVVEGGTICVGDEITPVDE